MLNNLISIVLSIIAAFLYDAIKKAYSDEKTNSQTESIEYSKKYIHSVKCEFYVGFLFGIIFISIPDTRYSFFNLGFNIIAYFSFFIALMGFMCLAEVVEHMSNKTTDNNTNTKTDI